jgi:hypothetical protein
MTDWYSTFAIALTLGVLAGKDILSLRDILFIVLVSSGVSFAVKFMSGLLDAIKTGIAERRRMRL